jgi:porin
MKPGAAPTLVRRAFRPRLLAALAAFAWAGEGAAEGGIDLGLLYTSDALANLEGGIQRGTALLGKVDAVAQVDGSAWGLPGVTGYLNLQFVHGRALSEELVGDAQVTSNIEAVSALRPFEAWLEFALAGDAAKMKAGLVDLNGEFDVQNVGALFLNSSHGIGPDFSQSGLNGPSIFPTTSGAIVLSGRQGKWSGRVGLFDAVSGDPDRPRRTRIGYPGENGLLAVGEVEYGLGEGSAVKTGIWTYTGRFDALDVSGPDGDPRRIRGNRGGYATIEARLASRGDRFLDAWVRAGFADARINPISSALLGGVTWGNDKGAIGLAVSRAVLGGPARRAAIQEGPRPKRAETNVELTYRFALRPGVVVQPDVQYVANPSWRRDIGDALVAGVRVIFEIP